MSRLTHFLMTFWLIFCGAVAVATPGRLLQETVSPNGHYRVRAITPMENETEGNSAILVLETVATTRQIAATELDHYGASASLGNTNDLLFLWSPDSKRIAVMVRDGKHSWITSLYSIDEGALQLTELRAASDKARSAAATQSGGRTVRVGPSQWLDEDRLVIRASGDARKENQILWYEVDLTYSIKAQTFTEMKIVSTVPYEG